jgi:pyruvate dehydrogenase E1 component
MVETLERPRVALSQEELATLESIQRRVLWYSTYMVHNANSVRPNLDGLKVGGHQASSASIVSIFTALYFHYLRAGDRVVPKPHGSPAYHGIQYLLGWIEKEWLPTLRQFHGLQSYPSRTKDPGRIDFSLGSMGFGATAPTFAAMVKRYADAHFGADQRPGRFVAVVGDAELDEGSVWEAVAEEHVYTLGNVFWIVDLNRQSLDRVIPGIRAGQLEQMFRASGWNVIEAKYGRKLEAVFARPGGDALRECLDAMSNQQYQALLRVPGAEIRQRLRAMPNGGRVARAIERLADQELPDLIGDLGGHDLSVLLDRFARADAHTSSPTGLIASTLTGWGLPFAGDPSNHSALMSDAQIEELRARLEVPADDPWAAFPADSPESELIRRAAERMREEPIDPPSVRPDEVPPQLGTRFAARGSTQEAFGRLMADLPNVPKVGERIVTTAADVAVSTNLGGWVNKVGVFHAEPQEEVPLPGPRLVRWAPGPKGQHVEFGIAEMNLFTFMGQAGLARELLGQHLIPLATIYDPFICRGLDAIVHAVYSASKFIIVATPSGLSLAPEGGAHQSTITQGIGLQLPNMRAYEPCFARELEWLLMEAIRQCCDREHGLASYLRLTTKQVDQGLIEPALARLGEERLRADVLAGGYRLVDWRDRADQVDGRSLVQIAAVGTVVPEAVRAAELLAAEGVAANVLNLTSVDRLYAELADARRRGLRAGVDGWEAGHLGRLIPPEERAAPIVTVLDGASHTLAFLGSAFGAPVVPLGVDAMGQSGTMAELYREYGIDADHIVNAALMALDFPRER